jgi:hypothetical protein
MNFVSKMDGTEKANEKVELIAAVARLVLVTRDTPYFMACQRKVVRWAGWLKWKIPLGMNARRDENGRFAGESGIVWWDGGESHVHCPCVLCVCVCARYLIFDWEPDQESCLAVTRRSGAEQRGRMSLSGHTGGLAISCPGHGFHHRSYEFVHAPLRILRMNFTKMGG